MKTVTLILLSFITSLALSKPIVVQSKNVYQFICKAGHPFRVAGNKLDDSMRYVYFKGSFQQSHFDKKEYSYVNMRTSNLEEGHVFQKSFMNKLNDYQIVDKPEDLPMLKIPLISPVPSNEIQLKYQLGQWQFEHSRKYNKKRVVYDRKICINGVLATGMYFDIKDGKVIKAKATKTKERLARVAYDLRTFKSNNTEYEVDTAFVSYGSEAIARKRAIDTLLTFVVLKETDMSNKAYDLLSRSQSISDSLRKQCSPTNKDSEIDVSSLKYKITSVEGNRVKVMVHYKLNSGESVKHHYGLDFQWDRWGVFE